MSEPGPDMSLPREALLAELGIPRWRARPGVAFPGAPAPTVAEVPRDQALVTQDMPVTEPMEVVAPEPVLDLCVHARVSSPSEAALLENILQAARGLREGLRVGGCPWDDAQARTRVLLDGHVLPSLTAMAADPSLKRPVWAAIKAAVASLA